MITAELQAKLDRWELLIQEIHVSYNLPFEEFLHAPRFKYSLHNKDTDEVVELRTASVFDQLFSEDFHVKLSAQMAAVMGITDEEEELVREEMKRLLGSRVYIRNN